MLLFRSVSQHGGGGGLGSKLKKGNVLHKWFVRLGRSTWGGEGGFFVQNYGAMLILGIFDIIGFKYTVFP